MPCGAGSTRRRDQLRGEENIGRHAAASAMCLVVSALLGADMLVLIDRSACHTVFARALSLRDLDLLLDDLHRLFIVTVGFVYIVCNLLIRAVTDPLFCFSCIIDDAPSRKEISHVLVRLLLRKDVKTI